MLRPPLLYLSEIFAKIPLADRNIFGMCNVIDAAIDSWDEQCVYFGGRINFMVV